jgi:hypothetical protein
MAHPFSPPPESVDAGGVAYHRHSSDATRVGVVTSAAIVGEDGVVDNDEERVLRWFGSWRSLPDFARIPVVEAVAAWCPLSCDASVEGPRFLDQLDGVLAAATSDLRARLAQQLVEEFPWFLPVERHADKLVGAALRRRRRLLDLEDPNAFSAWLTREVLPAALCEALADGNRAKRLSDARGRRVKIERGVHVQPDGRVVRPVRGTPALLSLLEMPRKWLVPELRRRALECAGYRVIAQTLEDRMSRRVDRPSSEVAREPNWHERDPEAQQHVRDLVESRAHSDAEEGLIAVASEVTRRDPALLAQLSPALRRLCQAFLEGWRRERILIELGLTTDQYRQQKKRLFDTLGTLRARS